MRDTPHTHAALACPNHQDELAVLLNTESDDEVLADASDRMEECAACQRIIADRSGLTLHGVLLGGHEAPQRRFAEVWSKAHPAPQRWSLWPAVLIPVMLTLTLFPRVLLDPSPEVAVSEGAPLVAPPPLAAPTLHTAARAPQNAGPAPRIHFAEDTVVSEASPVLKDNPYATTALRVSFLVCDVSGQYELGDPVTWTNQLTLRNRLVESSGKRNVELLVSPRGSIRYTQDGREPRDGTPYSTSVEIGDDEVLLRAFASIDGLETKADFRFPARGRKGLQIDDVKPARLVSRTGRKLDSRATTFEGLKQAADKSAEFENVSLTIGQGNKVASVMVGEVRVDAAFITTLLTTVLGKFAPDTPVTMTFRKAHFASGHDLKDFAGRLGIELEQADVEQ